jgi:SAM-dependent methyltransferase
MLKAVIPKRYHPYAEQFYLRLLRPLWYVGNRYNCPCCGWHFRKFLPFGIKRRPNAQCPKCGSLERHRLLWLFVKSRTNLFSDNLKVLHFAPEYCLQRILRLMPNLDYVSADLDSPLATIKMDITNILFKDNSFDVILCSHVLEHIIDDYKAMRELFRVLKPGGWGILQTPIDSKRDKTFEDSRIVSPEERERFFGQSDHVRIYGRDYVDRLKEAGFEVLLIPKEDLLNPDELKSISVACENEVVLAWRL